MKKSARVSEKLVSPGLPDLQVATRLTIMVQICLFCSFSRDAQYNQTRKLNSSYQAHHFACNTIHTGVPTFVGFRKKVI